MTLTPEKFKDYFRIHKLASKEVVEKYMEEYPKDEYHYEDIDAVYQRQIDIVTSIRDVHSQSEMLAGLGHNTHSIGHGCYRTINGVGPAGGRYKG